MLSGPSAPTTPRGEDEEEGPRGRPPPGTSGWRASAPAQGFATLSLPGALPHTRTKTETQACAAPRLPILLLSRLKVLDLTRVLAGPSARWPWATWGPGDQGRAAGTGDQTRWWGPPFDADGHSAYFLSVNRNKLSPALDFDDPADQEVLGIG